MEQNLNTVYKSVEIKSAVLGSKPCVQNTAIFQDIVQCSEVLWESPAQTQSFSYRHNHGDHCTSSQTTFLKQRQQQREKKTKINSQLWKHFLLVSLCALAQGHINLLKKTW